MTKLGMGGDKIKWKFSTGFLKNYTKFNNYN